MSDRLELVDFAIALVNSVLFQANVNDSWVSKCELQLARIANCKTDFLCTLHVSFSIGLGASITEGFTTFSELYEWYSSPTLSHNKFV